MDTIREKWAALSPKTQFIAQIAIGILLAIASGVALFVSSEEDSGFVPVLIAFGAALIIPNILEKQLESNMSNLKRTIAIALGAIIVGAVIFAIASGKKFFN